MWTATRRTAATAVTLALAVGLSACDVDDDPEVTDVVDDADTVVVADEDDDTTVTVDEADGTVVVEGSEEAQAALLEAVAATRDRAVRASFDVAFAGTDSDGVIGEGVVGDGDLQATMRVRGPLVTAFSGANDAEIEVRVVDGVTWLRWPALLAEAGLDAEWLLLEDADAELDFGDLVDRARLSDPTVALAILDDLTAVAEVEDGFVDGDPATRYVATVELSRAVAASPIASDVFGDVGGEADRALDVDVWVGEDGLVRRVEVDMDRDGTTSRLLVDVLEVDVEVDVESPPADQVATLGEYRTARG